MYYFDKTRNKILYNPEFIHINEKEYHDFREDNSEYLDRGYGIITYDHSTNKLVIEDIYKYLLITSVGEIFLSSEDIDIENHETYVEKIEISARQYEEIENDILEGFVYYYDDGIKKVKLEEKEYFDYKIKKIINREYVEMEEIKKNILSEENKKKIIEEIGVKVSTYPRELYIGCTINNTINLLIEYNKIAENRIIPTKYYDDEHNVFLSYDMRYVSDNDTASIIEKIQTYTQRIDEVWDYVSTVIKHIHNTEEMKKVSNNKKIADLIHNAMEGYYE